jgi:hypothetical protein
LYDLRNDFLAGMTIKVSRCVQQLGVDTSVVQFVQNDTSFGVLGVFIKVGWPGWPEVFWWNAIDKGFSNSTPVTKKHGWSHLKI